MPLSALLLQYAIPLVFLLILVDCWRTPNLLPLFGSVRTARIAWSLAIITANPFLLVVYLVVARKQWWTTQREQRRDRVLLACIGASVLLQIPFGQSDYKKVVLPNGESISSWGLSVQANSAMAGTNSSSMTRGGSPPVAVGKIRVTASKDPLSWAIGKGVAELFTGQPWAETVELWPRGTVALDESTRSADIFVDIDATDCGHLPLPFFNRFNGSIRISVLSEPHNVENTMPGNPDINLSPIESSANISLSFVRVGLAWGSSYYGGPAAEIVSRFDTGSLAYIRDLVAACGIAGEFPGALNPKLPPLAFEQGTTIPSFLVGKDALVQIEDSYSPFIHNRSSFQFEDDRRALIVLGELKEDLTEAGWTNFHEEENLLERSHLKARKAGATLIASRWPRPRWRAMVSHTSGFNSDGAPYSKEIHQPEPPLSGDAELYVVTITYPFPVGELRTLAMGLASSPPGPWSPDRVGELLVLRKYLNDPGEELLRQGLRDFPSQKGADWLTLTKLDTAAGDFDAAAGAAQTARALFELEGKHNEKKTVEKLIEEHSLAVRDQQRGGKSYLDFELLSGAGFPALGPDRKSVSLSIGLGETARVVTKGADGEVAIWSLGVMYLEPEILLTSVVERGMSSTYTSGTLESMRSRIGNGLPMDLVGEVKGGRLELEITVVE